MGCTILGKSLAFVELCGFGLAPARAADADACARWGSRSRQPGSPSFVPQALTPELNPKVGALQGGARTVKPKPINPKPCLGPELLNPSSSTPPPSTPKASLKPETPSLETPLNVQTLEPPRPKVGGPTRLNCPARSRSMRK